MTAAMRDALELICCVPTHEGRATKLALMSKYEYVHATARYPYCIACLVS